MMEYIYAHARFDNQTKRRLPLIIFCTEIILNKRVGRGYCGALIDNISNAPIGVWYDDDRVS